MQEAFKKVFPTLQWDDYFSRLLEQVTVEDIRSDKEYSYLRVCVLCRNVVSKKDLRAVEKTMSMTYRRPVYLVERYTLATVYPPSELIRMFRNDFASDLEQEGAILSRMFQSSTMDFPEENLLVMTIPQKQIYETRAGEMKEWLVHVMKYRFGVDIRVQFHFKKTGDSRSLHGSSIRAGDLVVDLPVKKEVPERRPATEAAPAKPVKEPAEAPRRAGRRPAEGLAYGRNVDGDVVLLSDVGEDPGEYVFRVMILGSDHRTTRTGKFIVSFDMTDFTDSLAGKLFVNTEEELEELTQTVHKGAFVKIKGRVGADAYEGQFMMTQVTGIEESSDFRTFRRDTAPHKRIELCAHTKMSKMEAVCDAGELVRRAKSWGHPAVAITDYGVVHAFPEAAHALSKDDDFKIIYGMTANLVDDEVLIVNRADDRPIQTDIVVFDLETTGFHATFDKIIEIGAVRIHDGMIQNPPFQMFVNPKRPLPYEIVELTGITDSMLRDAPTIEEALPEFHAFCEGAILAAHNAPFDMSFLDFNAQQQGLSFDVPVLDTLVLARRVLHEMKSHRLGRVAKHYGISLENAHRAHEDAMATAGVLLKLLEDADHPEMKTLQDINTALAATKEDIIRAYPFHVNFLVKNETGRVNLYRMVSESHLTYFRDRPKIPKSLLEKHREGLLIGSGTVDGELQQAILRGRPDYVIEDIVSMYDYLEVQPPAQYLADKSSFSDREIVISLIRNIIRLGEKFDKPVVATGNVHFMEKEDSIYRRILKYGDKKKLKYDIPYEFLTTDEMLDAFAFLGEAKAFEIVVENTHRINAMIEKISPVRPDKCPPVMEGAEEDLRNMCYAKAKEVYGEPLPEIVEARLEKELKSIIGNGFAVMYIIAHLLVKKSNEDGYLVGSRGSVGSSFVATMAGITEVNPLPPHYYCSECHYYEFDSETIRAHEGVCGWDLPDKTCPKCGAPLHKEGFDIPFETFLGFKGNKEPDIDLNFSGEYQSRAHEETEVIFGKGHTFRAGTISGVAEKTAYGFVRGYLEEQGITKRNCEIARLATGVQGVKRTTGQHPGGIIVLPKGEEINTFTPVQHPADDVNSNIITTHFDYHSIDHNLLKLDILGHDDPTMIRRLEELTGLDATKIPLDEPKVMSIFASPEALHVTSQDILGCPVGCRGIPEFGTEFTINMVVETQPKLLSDLINISGLSHGTDVWVGNARDLINSGTATISECICTRDGIMTYLIARGLENETAFTIMESVRKGKGLRPEWEDLMREHDVPEWYIESCKKIKYMFPKAHAVAYVMMGYRIAYFKVYYPLEYYAAFFSIRASGFDFAKMCGGRAKVEHYIETYKAIERPSATEKDALRDLLMVQEFYARGFDFAPVDLYKVQEDRFTIIDGKIMPSLKVIAGLGSSQAHLIVEEAKRAPFLSKEDLKKRCHLSSSVMVTLDEYGVLQNWTDTNQTSVFDFLD